MNTESLFPGWGEDSMARDGPRRKWGGGVDYTGDCQSGKPSAADLTGRRGLIGFVRRIRFFPDLVEPPHGTEFLVPLLQEFVG